MWRQLQARKALSYSDLLKPSRSLITASSRQNSSSPISCSDSLWVGAARIFWHGFDPQQFHQCSVHDAWFWWWQTQGCQCSNITTQGPHPRIVSIKLLCELSDYLSPQARSPGSRSCKAPHLLHGSHVDATKETADLFSLSGSHESLARLPGELPAQPNKGIVCNGIQ